MPKEDGKFVPPKRLFHMPHPHLRHRASDITERTPNLVITAEQAEENEKRMQEAQSWLGKDFLGPEAVRRAFGVNLLPQEISILNTDPTMLRDAKRDNLALILRINESADGEPLTIHHMEEILHPVFSAMEEGKVIHPRSLPPKQEFFTEDTPRTGWFFVSKDIVQGTGSRNYLDQSHIIGDYLLGSTVFKKQRAIEHAIDYLKLQNPDFQKLLEIHPERAVATLSYALFNTESRQTPVEIVYDLLAYFQNTGERLLPKQTSLTAGRNYFMRRDNFIVDNHFIGVGSFTPDGIKLTQHRTSDLGPNVGACVAFKV